MPDIYGLTIKPVGAGIFAVSEGNSVIVSGYNLTVLHAGRHIIFGREKKP